MNKAIFSVVLSAGSLLQIDGRLYKVVSVHHKTRPAHIPLSVQQEATPQHDLSVSSPQAPHESKERIYTFPDRFWHF